MKRSKKKIWLAIVLALVFVNVLGIALYASNKGNGSETSLLSSDGTLSLGESVIEGLHTAVQEEGDSGRRKPYSYARIFRRIR